MLTITLWQTRLSRVTGGILSIPFLRRGVFMTIFVNNNSIFCTIMRSRQALIFPLLCFQRACHNLLPDAKTGKDHLQYILGSRLAHNLSEGREDLFDLEGG
jgi:hypothetical protein